MSESHNHEGEHISLYIVVGIFALAAVVYILHKAFKCYIKCTKKESVFKAGFRDDTSSTSSNGSPPREEPPTPPREEDPLMETV